LLFYKSRDGSLAITATDPTGNTTTRQYEVDSTGSGRTFTYDANGNLTADGTRTFEWDARNQIVSVTVGTLRTDFTYDGLHRRVRVVEIANGVTQSDVRFVWCESELCEDRSVDGATVTRRPLSNGEQLASVAHFFVNDHLGSVTEVTDGSSVLLARYAFDPWGRRTNIVANDATRVGFTGHQWQANGETWLSLYRAYDADLGRWISEDPLGLKAGTNLYAYVENAVTTTYDPLG
jgi:RHS repeat-associated protein